MDLAFLVLAAAESAEHKSVAPFYVAGLVLAGFAVVISVIGFTKPDFPSTSGVSRAVMALCTVLVVATMFTSIYVST